MTVADEANNDERGRGAQTYSVYIVRCEDGSLYTGITTDVERRLAEHMGQGSKAARYTRTHKVVKLEAAWPAGDRAAACALEYRIKRLSHAQKEELISSNEPPVL